MRKPTRRQAQGVSVRKTWIVIGATVALLAVAALPGTASASRRVLRTTDFRVEASNGYGGYVFAVHQLHPRRHAQLDVAVAKDDAYAAYSVPALFTRHHLKADLGQFGRINVRIKGRHRAASGAAVRRLTPDAPGSLGPNEPATKAGEHPTVCFISGHFQRKGFRGRIRFRGEDGYTKIHADRATGSYFSGGARCPRGRRARGTFLNAKAGSVEFRASHFRGYPEGTDLSASEEETAGRVSIERSAANYRGAIFDFNSDFTTAHVQPSEGPLSGSADFTAPDSWTGDLTASFPGEPEAVALTGPDFTARLRHVGP